MACQKYFDEDSFLIGVKKWQVIIVVVSLLINRWLWHASQSDATIFPRWQPPLSAAAFTYGPISEKTLQTIKDSAEKWRQLDGVREKLE